MAGIQDCMKIQILVSGLHHIKKQKAKQKNLIILDPKVEIDSFNKKRKFSKNKIKDFLQSKNENKNISKRNAQPT